MIKSHYTDIFKETYLRSEQPTTCPLCGSRTDIVLDLSHTIEQTQIHQCLLAKEHIFAEVIDTDS